MEEEVESVEVGKLEALHGPGDHALEVARHAGRGHVLDEVRVVLGFPRNQPHVGGVALVTGSGMSEVDQQDLALPVRPSPSLRSGQARPTVRRLPHTATTSTHGCTSRLSINAGQ